MNTHLKTVKLVPKGRNPVNVKQVGAQGACQAQKAQGGTCGVACCRPRATCCCLKDGSCCTMPMTVTALPGGCVLAGWLLRCAVRASNNTRRCPSAAPTSATTSCPTRSTSTRCWWIWTHPRRGPSGGLLLLLLLCGWWVAVVVGGMPPVLLLVHCLGKHAGLNSLCLPRCYPPLLQGAAASWTRPRARPGARQGSRPHVRALTSASPHHICRV